MTRALKYAALIVAAAGTLVFGQGGDATKVLADARAAMGGDKLVAVKTLTGTGRLLRTNSSGNTTENEFEFSLERPDKYMMRSVIAAMGSMSIYRNAGFNGGQVIDEIDRPPNLQGGVIMMRVAGPGGSAMDPEKMTPEQKAELDRTRLLQTRTDYTRLALGMFASAPEVFPLTFTYAGQAESPDGKADVIEVKGDGEFAARLFIDSQTHLPLMLSWMDKEPLVMTMAAGAGGPGGAQTVVAGGGGNVAFAGGGGGVQVTRATSGSGSAQMTPEQREQLMKDMEERRKEAEAKRRTVEYRVYYADYQAVNGAMLPHKIQRSVDGKPVEEMMFDKIKVNPKIDAKTFQPINK